MTCQQRLLVFVVAFMTLLFPCPGRASPAVGDSLVSCTDNTKAVPADPHVFGSNENLELLALRLSSGPYADKAVYERLVRDVSAIRTIETKIETVAYHAPDDGRSLSVHFTPDVLSQVKANRYRGWNCLNSFLGARILDWPVPDYILLKFRGIYNLAAVAQLYDKLPGVTRAEPNYILGDNSTIFVTREGSVWSYVFDLAGGDCPAGCTTHELYYFETTDNGHTRKIATANLSARELPDWVKKYFRQYH